MVSEEYAVVWTGGSWRDDRQVIQPKPKLVAPGRHGDPERSARWADTLIGHLKQHGPQTNRQLMAHFKVAHAAVYAPLERLQKRGSVQIMGWIQERGRPAKQYGLPESSR